jgi:hypothetical protein
MGPYEVGTMVAYTIDSLIEARLEGRETGPEVQKVAAALVALLMSASEEGQQMLQKQLAEVQEQVRASAPEET